MRQDFAFVAQRPLARHDPALVRTGPADVDLIGTLRQATDRLARTLRDALAPLCGGEAPTVTIDPPQDIAFADFAHPGLHAYSLYAATPGTDRLLSAIDAGAVLRLVDRAFGGPGAVTAPLPTELPLSAELMVQRIEVIIAAQIGQSLVKAPARGPIIRPLRRDTDLAQLQPFAPAMRLAVIDIAICQPPHAPWSIRMALPLSALAVLTGTIASPQPVPHNAPRADPGAQPFAALPLRMTALVVDARLPLRVVSQLEVGQVLNLPIARQVPLLIERRTVAHGTIGELDDRVAIQITRTALTPS